MEIPSGVSELHRSAKAMKIVSLMLMFVGAASVTLAATRKVADLHGTIDGAFYRTHDGRLSLTYPDGALVDIRNPRRLRIEIDERTAENAYAIEFGAEGGKFLRRKFSVRVLRKDQYPGDSIALPKVLESQIAWFRQQKEGKDATLSPIRDDRLAECPARHATLTFERGDRALHIIVFSQTSYVVVVVGEWAEIPFRSSSGELHFNEKYREQTRELTYQLAESIKTKAEPSATDNPDDAQRFREDH